MLTSVNWDDESRLGGPANRERIIRRLLNHFSELDLRDANLQQPDGGTGNVLGDAYEYLIHQFADDAGRKGGEFYTPRRGGTTDRGSCWQPQEGMRICDPDGGVGRDADLHGPVRCRGRTATG